MNNLENLKLHHTSLARGYVKVGTQRVEDYKGKFGTGKKVYEHNPKSTQYCYISYYVSK